MLIAIAIFAAVSLILLLLLPSRRRRKQGEPFDWSHRRPWWKPRSMFPDDR
jgi:hypothetical protein